MKQVWERQRLCYLICMHMWVLSASVMSDPATLWTVACQAPLSIRFFNPLKWVDLSSSRGSSQPRDQTHISCFGRWILYHWATWETLLTHTSGQWESRQGWPGSSWETSWKGIVYAETFLPLLDPGLHVMFGTTAASLRLVRCPAKQDRPVSIAILCSHE